MRLKEATRNHERAREWFYAADRKLGRFQAEAVRTGEYTGCELATIEREHAKKAVKKAAEELLAVYAEQIRMAVRALEEYKRSSESSDLQRLLFAVEKMRDIDSV